MTTPETSVQIQKESSNLSHLQQRCIMCQRSCAHVLVCVLLWDLHKRQVIGHVVCVSVSYFGAYTKDK